jgi:two-component system NtrC family sensor kinase
MSYALARALVRPIHELVRGTRRVAEGDLDVTLSVDTEDEFGVLARSFNKMASDLKTSYDQLNEYSTGLEHKVAERTRQFEEANWELEAQRAALEVTNREMVDVNAQLLKANEELQGAYNTITSQQQSLVRAAKMASMGTLAAGVAHEINNPLAIIAGYSESLLERVRELDLSAFPALKRLAHYLGVINSECFRCKEITQRLLALARERELARAVGNVNDSINETLTLLDFHPDHDASSVVVDLDPTIPDIACDPNQLQQVFLNLALNAMDAMGPGKKLYLTTALEGEWIRVEFRDEGSGISPDVLDRIFDPFFTTKPEGAGTGLGLAMCQAIIEQHEGTIEVASVVGEGTTFTIRLPAKEPGAAGRAAA